MKNLSLFLNEQNIIDQVRRYLVPTFGEEEYSRLIEAEPIAMLDGLMQLSITTKSKPVGTKHTSIEETPNGWVLIYKKI
jgi:hypothetical protein